MKREEELIPRKITRLDGREHLESDRIVSSFSVQAVAGTIVQRSEGEASGEKNWSPLNIVLLI